MKRNLLKSFVAALMLVAASVAAHAQCYIIGNDGAWATDKAGAELTLTDKDGVYEGDVTFAENSYYFFVTTALTEEADDWAGLLPFRYNPDNADEVNITYNEPSKLVPAEESQIDGSFKVADTGTHKIRVDFNEMTVTVEGAYPEKIYMLGSTGAWDLKTPVAMLERTENSTIYKGKVEVSDEEGLGMPYSFAFYTSLADDWDTANTFRFAHNGEVEPNQEYYTQKNAWATSTISRVGTYEVTVNYNEGTMQLYDPTYEHVPGAIFFVGDGNSWDTSSAFAKIGETDETGIYEGDVTFKAGFFTLATALTEEKDDWDTFRNFRYGPVQDGEKIGTSIFTSIAKGYDTAFNLEEDGTYTVWVNLNYNTFSMKKHEEDGITAPTYGTAADGIYYDLSGRRLGTDRPTKGIYIRDGKKIAVE